MNAKAILVLEALIGVMPPQTKLKEFKLHDVRFYKSTSDKRTKMLGNVNSIWLFPAQAFM